MGSPAWARVGRAGPRAFPRPAFPPVRIAPASSAPDALLGQAVGVAASGVAGRGRRRRAAGAWSSPSVASRRRVCGRRRARRRGGGGVAPCAGSGPCGRAGGRDVARASLTGSTPVRSSSCRARRSPFQSMGLGGWSVRSSSCRARVLLSGGWDRPPGCSGPVLAAHACLLSGRWGRAGRSGPVLAAHVVLLSGAGDGLVGQVQFLPRTGGPLSASEAG
jgi:hypothetical protein